jgi:hypothetical protein
MPDNSSEPGVKRTYRKLRPGRFPKWMRPSVPFRIEEWGKGQRVRPPEWWPEALRVIKSGKPYYLRDGQEPQGTAMRGRPGLGTLAIYIGENTKAPRPKWALADFRVVKEGFGRTEKEAQERADAWVRVRLFESGGKARRRALSAKREGPVRQDSTP